MEATGPAGHDVSRYPSQLVSVLRPAPLLCHTPS